MEGFPEIGFSSSYFSPETFLRSLEGRHHGHHHRKRTEEKPEAENQAQVSAQAVQVSQATTADYNIVTKEGDKVTISGSSRYDLAYSTYNASGRLNDQSVSLSGESFSLSASREFNIQVEGDLSEEELRDIRKLIKGSKEVLRDFMRGDVDEAFEDTLKLGKLDTLASFQADLTISRSIAVSQVTAQSPITLPADNTVTPEENEAAPTQEQALTAPKASAITAASSNNIALSIKGQIDQSGIAPEKLVSPYENLFADLAKDASAEGGKNNGATSVLLKLLKEQILAHLQGN